MAAFVTGTDIGGAWLAAFKALDDHRGSVVNLAVEITSPLTEDRGIRGAIENALVALKASHPGDFGNVQSMHTVANTVFPISLYRPDIEGAADRFVANALKVERNRQHASHRHWGTYLGRLVAYPSRDGKPTNQVEAILSRLTDDGAKWSDVYEIPIAAPDVDQDAPDWEGMEKNESVTAGIVLHGDIRLDARRRGGPCLAHISLTLEVGVLSMLAVYRRHSYVPRAYGNFLGLARLLSFFAQESGKEVGNLLVVTGHAVPDAPGRAELLSAATAAAGNVTEIETHARPVGSSWGDLELVARRQETTS